MKEHPPIPLFRPRIPNRSQWWMLYERALASGQLTNFGENYRLAQKILNEQQGGHWVLVTNGTVALEVASMVEFGTKGRTVYVPDFTFAATLNAVARSGNKPVIVGCGFDYQVKPVTLQHELLAQSAEQSEPPGLMVVAPFGYWTNFKAWGDISARWRVPIVYDLAGAWPLTPPSGTACYSLHAAKSMPVGEGGMIRFDSEAKAALAESLINFGFDPSRTPTTPLAGNGKLDELHCAILVAHLRNQKPVEERIKRIKSSIDEYQAELAGYCQPSAQHLMGAPSICALRGFRRPDELVKFASRSGVTLRRYYWPFLSEVLAYEAAGIQTVGRTDDELRTVVALPSDATAPERERVVDVIQEHQDRVKA